MKSLTSLVCLVALALCLTVSSVSAQDTATPTVSPLSLLPQGVTAILYVKNIGDLEAKVKKIAIASGESDGEDINIDDLAGLLLGLDMAMDKSKGMAIGVIAGETMMDMPSVVAVLPFADVDEAMSELSGMSESEPVKAGSFVAFAPIGTFKAGPPTKLALGMPQADVAFRVDMATISDNWGEDLLGMMSGMKGEMSREMKREMGDAAGPFVDAMDKFAQDFVKSAEVLDYAVRFDGKMLDMRMDVAMRKGSPLDKSKFMSQGAGLAPLAGVLPQEHPVASLISLDVASMMGSMKPMMMKAMEGAPEAERKTFTAAMEAVMSLYEGMGDDIGWSLGVGKGGLEIAQVFEVNDGPAYLDRYLKTVSGKAMIDMGVTFKAAEKKEVDGVIMTEGTIQLDTERLGELTGERMPPSEQMEGMVGMITGEQGPLRIRMAATAQHLLATIGGGTDLMKRAVAGVKGKASNQRLNHYMKLAGTSPGMVVAVELRSLINQMRGMAQRFGQGEEIPQVPGTGPIPMGLFAGRSGRTYRFGTELDLMSIMKFAKSVQ